jgi:short-subunit dehydrogenase
MDVALVTGASSGIGLCIAEMLIGMNYTVYGFARDFTKTTFTHANFYPRICDVMDTHMLVNETQALLKETDRLDVLINNAGVGFFGPHETISPEKIERMVKTNLLAPMVLTQTTLRHLKKSKGFIINMASTAALEPGRFGGAYGATKAGVHQFSQSLFAEVRKSGVKVVTLYPDMTMTPFYDETDFAPHEDPACHITPACVADAVAQAISQREGTVLTQIVLKPQRVQVERKRI